jgi:ribosomal protein S18 acetylase RimI-like enzyme
MQVSLRKATSEDYTALCLLFDEIDALHREHLPAIYRKPDGPARQQDYYLGLLAEKENALFVAEVGANLVGVVHAVFKVAPATPIHVPRSIAVVDSIVVKSAFQNQGIGKMLMRKTEEWAAELGATSIELNVYEFNLAAIAFYQGLGFKILYRRLSQKLDLRDPGARDPKPGRL